MKKGDFVRIKYIGRLESGEIFDITDEEVAKKEKIYNQRIKYGPVPIVVGAGFVIPGLENALIEMNLGEKRTVEIEPKDAFGDRNPELVKTVPQAAFKKQKVEPVQGMIVDFGGMKGRIQSVGGGRVRVDFNNPLAGKILKYELEIVENIEEHKDQIKSVFDFFGLFDIAVEIKEKEAVITGAVPQELKKRLSTIVLENVKNLDRVVYQEVFSKEEKAAKEEPVSQP